jgi:hypothetical protein
MQFLSFGIRQHHGTHIPTYLGALARGFGEIAAVKLFFPVNLLS